MTDLTAGNAPLPDLTVELSRFQIAKEAEIAGKRPDDISLGRLRDAKEFRVDV